MYVCWFLVSAKIFGHFTIKWNLRAAKNPPATSRRKLLNAGGEINRATRKTTSGEERNKVKESEREREPTVDVVAK